MAWNPLVEARLIERASHATTLTAAAMARLRREHDNLSEQGQGRSAAQAVNLLTRACLIGLHQQLPALLSLIAALLDEDSNAASVITCSHRLLMLWRGREPLGLQDHPQLRSLLLQSWNSALYLMPQLAQSGPEDEAAAIASLKVMCTLHGALRQLAEDAEQSSGLWRRQLHAMVELRDGAAGVSCAAAAVLFIDGAWSEAQLAALLRGCFGPGSQAHLAVRGLKGVMAVAPELLLTQASLRRDISGILGEWDEQTFVSFLPDLRQAFTALKPQETAQLAEALAGGDQQAILAETHYATTEADLMAGAALQASLAESLARDGLDHWIRAAGGRHG